MNAGAPLFTLVIFMHFIILLTFVLNFVLFFNLFTLVIFMKVDSTVGVIEKFLFRFRTVSVKRLALYSDSIVA